MKKEIKCVECGGSTRFIFEEELIVFNRCNVCRCTFMLEKEKGDFVFRVDSACLFCRMGTGEVFGEDEKFGVRCTEKTCQVSTELYDNKRDAVVAFGKNLLCKEDQEKTEFFQESLGSLVNGWHLMKKIDIFREFVSLYKKKPSLYDVYRGFRIGLFFGALKYFKKNNTGDQLLACFEPFLVNEWGKYWFWDHKDETSGSDKPDPGDFVNIFHEFVSANMREPREREKFQGFNIGEIYSLLKKQRRKGEYSDLLFEFEPYLEDVLGLTWYIHNDSDRRKVEILMNYISFFGKPRRDAVYCDLNVGRLFYRLRNKKRNDVSSPMLDLSEHIFERLLGDDWYI